jgi:hypothetical protein
MSIAYSLSHHNPDLGINFIPRQRKYKRSKYVGPQKMACVSCISGFPYLLLFSLKL